jgi:predicted NUDIX family NTP pyrophosphohydrolase
VTRPVSSGILLYRFGSAGTEVLLGHPGGPFWQRRDKASWSLLKGLAEDGEEPSAVAAREFAEETGFALDRVASRPGAPPEALGQVILRSGKVILGFAVEGDLDPGLAHSNEFELEWPPRSGQTITIPEVDRVAWFGLPEAGERIHPGQRPFVDRLEQHLRLPRTG